MVELQLAVINLGCGGERGGDYSPCPIEMCTLQYVLHFYFRYVEMTTYLGDVETYQTPDRGRGVTCTVDTKKGTTLLKEECIACVLCSNVRGSYCDHCLLPGYGLVLKLFGVLAILMSADISQFHSVQYGHWYNLGKIYPKMLIKYYNTLPIFLACNLSKVLHSRLFSYV